VTVRIVTVRKVTVRIVTVRIVTVRTVTVPLALECVSKLVRLVAIIDKALNVLQRISQLHRLGGCLSNRFWHVFSRIGCLGWEIDVLQ